MKKFLSLVFSFLPLLCFSQSSDYVPFPSFEGEWTYQYYDDYGDPSGVFNQYWLSGDTLIGDSLYRKIYSTPYLDNEEVGYKGAYREENKVIFYIPDSSQIEYVLYDFNLSLGDSVFDPIGGASCASDHVILEWVDSILINDNYHKRFLWSSSAVWIEGLGSQFYLLHPFEALCKSGNYRLDCMTNDGVIILGASNSNCFVSIDENEGKVINPFPNPNDGSFNIPIEDPIDRVQIFTMEGKEVFSASNTSNHIVTGLPKGIYILRIEQQEISFSSKLIVD